MTFTKAEEKQLVKLFAEAAKAFWARNPNAETWRECDGLWLVLRDLEFNEEIPRNVSEAWRKDDRIMRDIPEFVQAVADLAANPKA